MSIDFFKKVFTFLVIFHNKNPQTIAAQGLAGLKNFQKKLKSLHNPSRFSPQFGQNAGRERGRGAREKGRESRDGTLDVPLRGLRTFAAAFCLPCVKEGGTAKP